MSHQYPIHVDCNHCTFIQKVASVEEGVELLAQHTIYEHPEVADASPIVHVWRMRVQGEASFNGHNKVSSEGISYLEP